jgi:hypothetical protein
LRPEAPAEAAAPAGRADGDGEATNHAKKPRARHG